MIPILSLLVVVSISLALTRIATVALVHTGLGREAARFQARSAFTGVGFTTGEAESVVGHPVRRRIVMWLMLVGNIGVVAAMSSLLLSFLDLGSGDSNGSTWAALAVLFGGLGAIALLASSQKVDTLVCRAISAAIRRFTSLDARDYAGLLHLRGDYGVSELLVERGDWIAGKTLGAAAIAQEGLLVLGVECPGGHFVGAPPPELEIRAGDRVILYGRTPRIAELDRRYHDESSGPHDEAVSEHVRINQSELAQAGR